jgi:hypothetical protein
MTSKVNERRVLPPVKLESTNDLHPIIQNRELPKGMFLGAFIGPRASGKTHLACQLIKRMEQAGFRDPEHDLRKVPIRTILVSPTIDANKVFKCLDTLKDEDNVHDFSFKKWEDVWGDVKRQKELAQKYMKEREVHERKEAGHRLTEREESIIQHLHGEPPKPEGRYHIPPVTICVFDDLANSAAYKPGSNNSLTNAAIRNRHNRCCMIMAVQHAKSVPKVLRQNISLLAIGKFASAEYILDDLYELVSAFLTQEQFMRVYEQATSEDHGFLCCDIDTKRITRNFEVELDWKGPKDSREEPSTSSSGEPQLSVRHSK